MKIKKYLCISSIFLSLAGIITCSYLRFESYNFNPNNVINNIEYLSSDDFKGRLSGSDSNNSATYEIANAFKNYGLEPLSESYFEDFSVKSPVRNNEDITLNISDKDKIVKEFKVGYDFKEDMLNFKTTNVQISNKDKIEIAPRSICVLKDNKTYLFTVTLDKDFSFRSSFYCDSIFDFVIQINTNTFNEILNSIRKGYILNINLPYKIEDIKISNVVGKIHGTNSELPPLVFTAHFDHVGVDSLGKVYNGALDNASGTAFLLELARTYSTLKPPKRDIIFVALNAEEFGLLGSKEFYNKHEDLLKDSEIINFDMIGAKEDTLTFILGTSYENKKSDLLNDLKFYSSTLNTSYKVNYENSSDHASFNEKDIDSVTICHSDLTNIHTPRDTFEKLSTNSIKSVYNLINKKTINYAYYPIVILFYKAYTLIFFIILFIISSYIYHKKIR